MHVEPSPEQVAAGHAFYTRRSLAVDDLAILGYFSRLAWRCPAHRIVDHYDQHVSANHLDVGVGTGYFLDHCQFPASSGPPRLALLDISSACLDAARKQIARLHPETILANALEPIHYDGPRFDSIGMNYVLHCLPGDMESKAVAIDHLTALANPGASVFGATLLHDGVHRTGSRPGHGATTPTASSRTPTTASMGCGRPWASVCPTSPSRLSDASGSSPGRV